MVRGCTDPSLQLLVDTERKGRHWNRKCKCIRLDLETASIPHWHHKDLGYMSSLRIKTYLLLKSRNKTWAFDALTYRFELLNQAECNSSIVAFEASCAQIFSGRIPYFLSTKYKSLLRVEKCWVIQRTFNVTLEINWSFRQMWQSNIVIIIAYIIHSLQGNPSGWVRHATRNSCTGVTIWECYILIPRGRKNSFACNMMHTINWNKCSEPSRNKRILRKTYLEHTNDMKQRNFDFVFLCKYNYQCDLRSVH